MSSAMTGSAAKGGIRKKTRGGLTGVKKTSRSVAAHKKKSSAPKKSAVGKTAASRKKRKPSSVPLPSKVIAKKIRKSSKIRAAYVAIGAAIAGLLVLFFAVYLNRANYYSDHFFDHCVINGVDCSGKSLAEVNALMQDTVNTYTLTVRDFEGRVYNADAATFHLTYEDDGSLRGILDSQGGLLWIFHRAEAGTHQITPGFTCDREAVKAWIESLDCYKNGTPPTDAYLQQGDDDYYTIVPETYGNLVDSEKMADFIIAALRSDTREITMTDPDTYCYVMPSVFSDDKELVEELTARNEAVRQQQEYLTKVLELTNVTVTLPGKIETGVLSQEQLFDWVRTDENTGEPYLDTGKAVEWVRDYSEKNGYNGSDLLFRTHSGAVVSVDRGTEKGWSLNIDETARLVEEAVINRNTCTISPVMTDTAGRNQSQETYVEISIQDQMLWCYENGVMKVETPIVSGNLSVEGRATPSNGIWTVQKKCRNYHMLGPLLEDGTRQYECDVNFWLPFNGDIGIHDLSNRESYGGDIYLRNGSHGCINTPLEAMEQVFYLVSIGTKVIVYD